jgi:lipopolysaccharide biosynthesis glycosyltransferase
MLAIYTGCPESHLTKRKLNISTTARANELIFLSMIKACSNWSSQLQKIQRFSKNFSRIVFCRAFSADHFGKKLF